MRQFVVGLLTEGQSTHEVILTQEGKLMIDRSQINPFEPIKICPGLKPGYGAQVLTAGDYVLAWLAKPERTAEERAAAGKYLKADITFN
jgi:hypothetical protein